MTTSMKVRAGLQWGSLAWLAHVMARALTERWSPMFLVWPVVIAAVILGRWTRAAVALGLLAQVAYGVWFVAPHVGFFVEQSGLASTARSVAEVSGATLCVGLIPLLLWPVTAPREAVRELVRFRLRDAGTAAGGALAIVAAIPVITANRAVLDAIDLNVVPLALAALTLLLARYGEVMLAWPWKGRHAFESRKISIR